MVLVPILPASYLSVYLSAPGEQQSFVSNALVETFDEAETGLYTNTFFSNIGTYGLSGTSAFGIQAADDFGGAMNSKYMTFGFQTGTLGSFQIDTNQDYNYFGFWWSAGDARNTITLSQSGTVLASITSADILNFLSAPKVTALNGTQYTSSSYYGNPNNPAVNTAEPYAFISVVLSGTTFNQVTFGNSDSSLSGFESDNHTVALGSINVPDNAVYAFDISVNAIPEPGTFTLLFAGLMATAFALRQKGSSRTAVLRKTPGSN